MNHAKRFVEHPRPTNRIINVETCRFKEIVDDFSDIRTRVLVSVSRTRAFVPFDWLKNARRPGPSCSTLLRRHEKLTHENSDGSRFVKFPSSPFMPAGQRSQTLEYLFLLFLPPYHRHKTRLANAREGKRTLRNGVLGFKMIGVKLG